MSEAFHRLDLARAVVDIRRFNYICKVKNLFNKEISFFLKSSKNYF